MELNQFKLLPVSTKEFEGRGAFNGMHLEVGQPQDDCIIEISWKVSTSR